MTSKATESERLRRTKQAAVAHATGQNWPVLAAETLGSKHPNSTVSPAAPSIIMPRADTELTSLLAGDDTVCVRRKTSPVRSTTVARGMDSAVIPARQPISGPQAFSGTQAESLAAMSRQFEGTAKDERKTPGQVAMSETGVRDLGAMEEETDLNLKRVQAAWPMLPRAAQAAILALINATLE